MHPWARDQFTLARAARLATVTPAGHPHLVPVVFAVTGVTGVTGATVWTAVDAKPKSTRRLRRLVNIESSPRVSLLVDHYEDDWSRLWWVRADGEAAVMPVGAEGGRAALDALAAKYPQYAAQPPDGPLIRIQVDTWASWSAG